MKIILMFIYICKYIIICLTNLIEIYIFVFNKSHENGRSNLEFFDIS